MKIPGRIKELGKYITPRSALRVSCQLCPDSKDQVKIEWIHVKSDFKNRLETTFTEIRLQPLVQLDTGMEE